MSEIEESWQQCLDYIRDAEIVSEKEFNTWLKTLKTRVQDGILEVVAANVLVYDFVEKKYWGRIEKVIHEFLGDIPVKLAVSAMRPKIDLTKNTEVSVTEKSLDSLNAVKPQVHTAVVNESRADLSQIKTRNTSSSKNADRQIIEQLHESTKLVKENNACDTRAG
jgi:chromosomal replication initiation ATPase DnaA